MNIKRYIINSLMEESCKKVNEEILSKDIQIPLIDDLTRPDRNALMTNIKED